MNTTPGRTADKVTHTPGPWTYQASAGNHDWLVYSENSDGKDIAIVRQFHEGNARLIAAAPDLLAALQWIVDHGDTGEGGRPAFHAMRAKARAAIQSATEGTP